MEINDTNITFNHISPRIDIYFMLKIQGISFSEVQYQSFIFRMLGEVKQFPELRNGQNTQWYLFNGFCDSVLHENIPLP